MKQKLFKNTLLLFLFGIIIVSCTLENEALHEHNHKNGLKIKTMGYAELMKNNQFSRAVKRIPKKQVIIQDFMDRSVIEDTYSFTILDAPVKVIEIDNKTTYTLQVVSDENTTGELENLILFENPIDDKIGHIVTYNTAAITDKTANEIVEAGIKETTTITTTDTNKGIVSMVLSYYCKAYGTSADCGGTNAATGCYQYWEMTVLSGGGGGGDGAAGFGDPADAGNTEIGVVEGSGGNINSPNEEEDNSVVISPTHCPGGCPEAEIENPLDCVTKEKLHEIFPSSSLENRTKLANNIRIYGGYFGINTKEEVCHFLAQVGAETGGLTTLNATENLNYTTASRLVQVFPSKFSLISHPTKVSPIPYLNNPSGLANLVYCCQYGNGDVASGDGWRYRGRGVLQLTWAGNYNGYQNYLSDIGLGWFYTSPNDLSNPDGIHSVLSGMWYFKKNVLDKMTINNTTPVKKVTKKINPALEKLNERKNYFNKAINVLNC